MSERPRIAIFGAGAIGCYLGGWLLKAYHDLPERLIFIGRDTLKDKLQEGLKVSDFNGNEFVSQTPPWVVSTGTNQTLTCEPIDILLITIKCTAIENSIEQLSRFVSQNTIIVCLQNGIGSERLIKSHFNKNKVVCGVVGFNSLAIKDNHYHRGTAGEVILEDLNLPNINKLVSMLNSVNIETELSNQIDAIRWGKLLLNLNNVINALSGIPLKEELSNRKYRVILAKAMQELLNTLVKANIVPAKLTAVSPHVLPYILMLPTPLFKLLANKMLAIDPLARSSMWHDIENRVETEIDFINGAVLTLAKQHQLEAPVNQRLVELMHKVQLDKSGSPKLKAEKLKEIVLPFN